MKKVILSILLVLLMSFGAYAQVYQTDLILTKPDAVWVDSRSYNGLSSLLTAIGSDETTIYIAQQEDFTGTIPDNVRLKFLTGGSINATGPVTINTKSIDAPNIRIFYGSGAYDFASGIELKSAWFEDFDEVVSETSDDEVTIIISQSETATTNASLGNDVVLRWDSPGNELTISSGIVISNVDKIIAGDYQIVSGDGRFDFNDGVVLKSTWFSALNEAGRHIDDTIATLEVRDTESINYDYTFDSNITLHFYESIDIGAGKTITIYSPENITAQPTQQIFSGSGSISFTNGGTIYPEWWGAVADDSTDCLAAFNAALASFSASSEGGTIQLQSGTYRISDEWDILKTDWDSTKTLVIKGDGLRNTNIKLANDTASYALKYDNGADESDYGTSYHKIVVKDFVILSTVTYSEGVTFHSGTGFYSTARASIYENLAFIGFTNGLHIYSGWSNTLRNLYANYCKKGITIDRSSYWLHIDHVDVSNSGFTSTPADGYGILLKRSGGISMTNMAMESSTSSGLIIEGCHGVTLSSSNIETYTDSRSIVLRGLVSANYADIKNWTTGVVIEGNRFWNALGILITDGGVGWVDIRSNSFINNPDQINPSTLSGFHISSGINTEYERNTLRNINISSTNQFLHCLEPTYHRTVGFSHAVFKDGWSMASSKPSKGTYELGQIVRNEANRSLYWVCQKDGTFGTLNSGNTTGTIDVGTDTQKITLNSLTGIFPGAKITIAGAGAAGADLEVTIGNVDVDNLAVEFYPAASTSVTDAAVSYTTPILQLSGEDHTEETINSSGALSTYGASKLNSSGGALALTLADGDYIGQMKMISMSVAGNNADVTIAHHETADDEVARFDAVDEYLLLVWTGTEWATVSNSCTFP